MGDIEIQDEYAASCWCVLALSLVLAGDGVQLEDVTRSGRCYPIVRTECVRGFPVARTQ